MAADADGEQSLKSSTGIEVDASPSQCCSPVVGSPCVGFGFKVVREPRRGSYGGAVDADISEALRCKKKTESEKDKLHGIKDQEALPIEAYNTLCPLEYCCGVSVEALPGGDTPFLVSTFGNAADAATLDKRKFGDLVVNEPVCHGSILGFPKLEEGGWLTRQEPRAFRQMQDEEVKEHFRFACQVLGLSYVYRLDDDSDRVCLRLPKDDVPGSVLEVKERIRKLLTIDHVNILRLRDAHEDEEFLYLIYDSVEGWGFMGLRVLTRKEPLDQSEVAKLCQQLAAAAAASHRTNVFHMDWTIWNIVSVVQGSLFPLKVFGFGLAGCLHVGRLGDLPEILYLSKGPFFYAPPELAKVRLDPEILQPLRKVDKNAFAAMDIWNIAVCVYTAVSTHFPFGGGNPSQICTNIIAKGLTFDASFKSIGAAGILLFEQMLAKDWRLRPRALDVISTGWVVTHVRAIEDRARVQQVVECMQEYSTLKPGMRALAKVLRQGLRIDKLRALEGLFHALDIRGDGELEPYELGAFFVDRNQELKDMFKVMDLSSDGSISLDEFVLSNVFGREVLTERMLFRTFEYLDLDGTGEITATELYAALRKVDPSLRPEHIGELMGDCDRDWDADIDFREFRNFFPQVISSSAVIEERVKDANDFQEVLEGTFAQFRDDCVQWRSDVNEQYSKAKKARRLAEGDSRAHKGDYWTRDMLSCVKKGMVLTRNPPRPSLPLHPYSAKLRDAEEARKAGLSKLKRRGQHAEESLEDLPGGPLNMDAFFRQLRSDWNSRYAEVAMSAKAASTIRNKQRKRQDVLTVLDDLEKFLKECYKSCEVYVDEQWDLIEATKLEGSLPKSNVPRRGLAGNDADPEEDDATAEIEVFIKERHAVLEQARQREESRADTLKMLYKSEVGGELRGYNWLERQVARAEKQGKAPPVAARSLQQITAQLAQGIVPPKERAEAAPGVESDGSGGGAEVEADEADEAPDTSPSPLKRSGGRGLNVAFAESIVSASAG